MNRAHRRAQAASTQQREAVKKRPATYRLLRRNAERWARGATLTLRYIGDELDGNWSFGAHVPADKHAAIADYATHAPMRWHITAVLVLRYDDGSQETREHEAECSQLAKIGELSDLLRQLMGELKAKANTRYTWDEYYQLRVMK